MKTSDTLHGNSANLVGEEDAIWLLRLVLPYVNEVLLNLRSLFSGEPATAMKVKKKVASTCQLVFTDIDPSMRLQICTDRVIHVPCSWHCCCLQWPGVATLSPSGPWSNWVSTSFYVHSLFSLERFLFFFILASTPKGPEVVKY
jgi:hypothetical protein